MAEVLLARTIGLGGFARHVVIKRIRVEHGSDQKQIEMFLDEARLVAALHHRNIVQVHDVGEEGGKYFIVMEYVHGRDTRELLKTVKDNKAQIPLEHIITIGAAAAAGLHYAHEQRGVDRKPLGIVHRDVSPGNILLGYDGGVKVVDFGIAKSQHRNIDTQAGEMKGKVGYMSPEQCKMQPLDRRTDVFLLGIVLYELVTVRRLFKADTRYATMSQIVDGAVPSPSAARSDLPPELERIILKALAKTPEERFQTADELRIALEAFAKSAGLSISPNALADYLKEQYGEVLEPWHVDEAVPHPPPEVIERIRNSSQLIAIQPSAPPPARPSAPIVEAKAIETPPDVSTSAESAADAAPSVTKSTLPELEAIKAAKPVVAGEPAGPDPDLVDDAPAGTPRAGAPTATAVGDARAADERADDKHARDKRADDKPAGDKRADDKRAGDKPAGEQATAHKSDEAAVKTPTRGYASGPAVYPTAPSSSLGWLWFVVGALVLVGGGIALYWFVLRPELGEKTGASPAVVEQPVAAPAPVEPPDAALGIENEVTAAPVEPPAAPTSNAAVAAPADTTTTPAAAHADTTTTPAGTTTTPAGTTTGFAGTTTGSAGTTTGPAGTTTPAGATAPAGTATTPAAVPASATPAKPPARKPVRVRPVVKPRAKAAKPADPAADKPAGAEPPSDKPAAPPQNEPASEPTP